MKKLFICSTLVACSAIAVAQANTSPSFRNYLSNRKSIPLYKPPAVPNLPGKNGIPIDALAKGNQFRTYDLKNFINKEKQTALVLGNLASTLPNGNKLFLLPQDNMPCIVPAQSQFSMPVVKGNNSLDKKINISTP